MGGIASSNLPRLERVSLILLGICAAILLIDSAVEAYTGPQSFGRCLLEWPSHLVLAVVVGGLCGFVPFTPVGRHLRWRVGALVALIGSVMWLAITIGVVAFYMLVMSSFD
jgi:peptidoglycan/LPS O-acetylase OafA/YrhL